MPGVRAMATESQADANCLTLIRTARGDGGEVEHLGELGVCEDVVLELDGAEVPGKLEQTLGLLVVDDEEHRVVLVDPLIRERRPDSMRNISICLGQPQF